MKSCKLDKLDHVYWTLSKIYGRRNLALILTFCPDDYHNAEELVDINDLIKAKTIKSKLIKAMYDTQE